MTAFDSFANIFTAAVLAGVPLLFGTVGEIVTQKSGSLNLGVEGLMYLGAICGFVGGYYSGSAAAALLAAFAGGMLGSLIFALLTVTLGANQNVTGLTLTLFGTGIANYMGDALINSSPLKAVSLTAGVKNAFKPVSIPVLSNIPYVGRLFFQYNLFVYLGIIIAIAIFVYMNKTRAGLNLRAIGENPSAADAAGVTVARNKYLHILLGGGICALGGAYIAIVTCGGTWVYNCVNGQGWIAVALVIFASWSSLRALIGSLVFGALVILRFYIPGGSVPNAVLMMLPFIVTCLVLIISSARQSREMMQPAACGINYDREQR